MAYYKKTTLYKRRKTTKGKRYAKVTVPRVRRVLMNMAERKFYTTTVTSGAMPAVWTWISHIGLIQQGFLANQRIGNKIFIRKMTWAGQMTFSAAAANVTGCLGRMVIYHNKETVGLLPALTPAVFDQDKVYAQRNITLKPRLSILKDMTHSGVVTATNGATPIATGPQTSFQVSIYPNKQIDFQSNLGTVADLFKDDYGMGMICNNTCVMEYYVTIEYNDV